MNDETRGKGVTKKIFKNWKELLNTLDFDENRYDFQVFTKSTFSKYTWHYLNTPEKAFKWCENLDHNLWQPWQDSKLKDMIHYNHGLWNNAMPTEYSKEDGLEYAKVS